MHDSCYIVSAPFLTYEFSVQPETRVGRGSFSVPRAFETNESGRPNSTTGNTPLPHCANVILSFIILTSFYIPLSLMQYLLLQEASECNTSAPCLWRCSGILQSVIMALELAMRYIATSRKYTYTYPTTNS